MNFFDDFDLDPEQQGPPSDLSQAVPPLHFSGQQHRQHPDQDSGLEASLSNVIQNQILSPHHEGDIDSHVPDDQTESNLEKEESSFHGSQTNQRAYHYPLSALTNKKDSSPSLGSKSGAPVGLSHSNDYYLSTIASENASNDHNFSIDTLDTMEEMMKGNNNLERNYLLQNSSQSSQYPLYDEEGGSGNYGHNSHSSLEGMKFLPPSSLSLPYSSNSLLSTENPSPSQKSPPSNVPLEPQLTREIVISGDFPGTVSNEKNISEIFPPVNSDYSVAVLPPPPSSSSTLSTISSSSSPLSSPPPQVAPPPTANIPFYSPRSNSSSSSSPASGNPYSYYTKYPQVHNPYLLNTASSFSAFPHRQSPPPFSGESASTVTDKKDGIDGALVHEQSNASVNSPPEEQSSEEYKKEENDDASYNHPEDSTIPFSLSNEDDISYPAASYDQSSAFSPFSPHQPLDSFKEDDDEQIEDKGYESDVNTEKNDTPVVNSVYYDGETQRAEEKTQPANAEYYEYDDSNACYATDIYNYESTVGDQYDSYTENKQELETELQPPAQEEGYDYSSYYDENNSDYKYNYETNSYEFIGNGNQLENEQPQDYYAADSYQSNEYDPHVQPPYTSEQQAQHASQEEYPSYDQTDEDLYYDNPMNQQEWKDYTGATVDNNSHGYSENSNASYNEQQTYPDDSTYYNEEYSSTVADTGYDYDSYYYNQQAEQTTQQEQYLEAAGSNHYPPLQKEQVQYEPDLSVASYPDYDYNQTAYPTSTTYQSDEQPAYYAQQSPVPSDSNAAIVISSDSDSDFNVAKNSKAQNQPKNRKIENERPAKRNEAVGRRPKEDNEPEEKSPIPQTNVSKEGNQLRHLQIWEKFFENAAKRSDNDDRNVRQERKSKESEKNNQRRKLVSDLLSRSSSNDKGENGRLVSETDETERERQHRLVRGIDIEEEVIDSPMIISKRIDFTSLFAKQYFTFAIAAEQSWPLLISGKKYQSLISLAKAALGSSSKAMKEGSQSYQTIYLGFFASVITEDIPTIQSFLLRGINPNTQDNLGRTVIHHMARIGNAEVAGILFDG
jgi:hypothetical protein